MLKLVRSLFLSYLFALFDFNLFSITSGADVSSYHGSYEEQMSCNKIKIYEDIGCICVTGLWRFYSDCSSFYTLAGNSYCFSQIPKAVSSTSNELKDVSYAMELLPSPHYISLVRGNSEIIKLDAHDDERELLASIKTEDLIVTGSRHTAKGPRGSVCFSPQENAYCTYRQPMDLVGGVLQNITMGCREDVPFVAPIFCDFIKAPQRCEDIPAPAPNKLSSTEDDALNEVEVKNEKTRSHLVRPKRKTHARNGHRRSHSDRSLSPASLKFGRTFLNAPGQNFETAVDLSDLDEDYLSAETIKNMTGLSHDAVLSEIWNYVETQAEVAMGLKKPLKNEIDYDVPYFKLLHLSKKVMQKVCPPSYVQPTFFDIATQAFIQVQVKRLIYEPPNANFPGFKRIVTALEKCIENATVFPFLTLENVNATVACDPKTLGDGQFAMFNGTSLDISITNTFIGLNKDPIIEAVWKIFYLAQSQCFPFFNQVSFNDHHRFTAWITPLFQNDITEIWTGGKSTIWTYGQFLGNLEEVMTKVAYCAASSRFSINKVEYPWELPRPVKEPPKPPPAGGPTGRRKKRSISNPLTTCLDDKAAESCFSTAKRFTSVSPSAKEVKNSALLRKQESTVRPDAVKSAGFLTSIINYM